MELANQTIYPGHTIADICLWAVCIAAPVSFLCLGVKWWKVRHDVAILTADPPDQLPTVHQFRALEAGKGIHGYAKVDQLRFVTGMVESRVQKEILQEEALLSSLHDRIVNGTDWYRESSALSILLALVITFRALFLNFEKIPTNSKLLETDLRPLLGLVGATWPLIFLGLVLYGCSAVWHHLVWKSFDAWRQWLETTIFPELGASRSTLMRLDRTMEKFDTTASCMTQLLVGIADLPKTMTDFQAALVNQIVPAIEKGWSKVSVGLSDDVIEKLTNSGNESILAIKKIQESQLLMLSITAIAEKRTTDLAAAVAVVAKHSGNVAELLEKQGGTLEGNTTALMAMGKQLESVETATKECSIALTNSKVATSLQAEKTESLAKAVQQLNPHVEACKEKLGRLSNIVANFDQSVADVQKTMSSMVEPISKTAASLPPFLTRAEELRTFWTASMTQMAALADEIKQRTVALDSNAQTLQGTIDHASGKLSASMVAMAGASNEFGLMRNEVGALNKQAIEILATFRKLQDTGEKLGELSKTITGNFEGWQKETQALFGHAESASRAAEASMGRVIEIAKSGTAAAQTTMNAVFAETRKSAEAMRALIERGAGLVGRLETALEAVPGQIDEMGTSISAGLTHWRRETAQLFNEAQSASRSVETAMERMLRNSETGAKSAQKAMDQIFNRIAESVNDIQDLLEKTHELVRELEQTMRSAHHPPLPPPLTRAATTSE